MVKHVWTVGALVAGLTLVGGNARANVLFNEPDFSNTTGLTLVGSATPTTTSDGTVLRLTPAQNTKGGAAYSTTPVTLGTSSTFSTTFQFRFTDAGGIDPADGITFVLAASSGGLGEVGGGLGYIGVPNSVAISFDTFNNGSTDGNSSNHVALLENGSGTVVSYVNPYGVNPCDFSSGHTQFGCMSNGDLWTATIGYNGTDLNVTVQDGNGAVFDALTNLPIDISSFIGSSTAYVGFTAATGAGHEAQDIKTWQFANDTTLAPPVPEPATLAVLSLGLAGLGMLRRRSR